MKKEKYVVLTNKEGKYYIGSNKSSKNLKEAKLYKNEKWALRNIYFDKLDGYKNLTLHQVEIIIDEGREITETELEEYNDCYKMKKEKEERDAGNWYPMSY